MTRRIALALLLVLPLAGCGDDRPQGASAAPDWRARLSARDRMRLRDWRTAWTVALAKARAGGAGAKIAAEGPLLMPDAGLDAPLPPDGAYRCRTIKLGAQAAGGLDYVAYGAFACTVGGGRLVKAGGSQRPAGSLHVGDQGRIMFVGGMALGDETGQIDYGRDPDRDVVGVVERIGPARWRLVMPYPRWESLIDIVELVPAN